ncbi:MAG: alpha/beta fold hydrolase [Mycoplasma sp.]
MKKNIINLYIHDFLPSQNECNDFLIELNKKYNIKSFEWKIDKDIHINFRMEFLLEQLDQFLSKFKDKKFNIIISGFGAMFFRHLHSKYKENINSIILINTLDNFSHRQGVTIKSKLLPTTIKHTIYKYMYLCHSLNNFRENENWEKVMRQESKILSNSNLFFNKVFDQLFRYEELNKHILWLSTLGKETTIIVGNKNPLIDLKLLRSFIKKSEILTIQNCGYCIEWEKPNILLDLVSNKIGK